MGVSKLEKGGKPYAGKEIPNEENLEPTVEINLSQRVFTL